MSEEFIDRVRRDVKVEDFVDLPMTEEEKKEAADMMVRHFGFIGSTDECAGLEHRYGDPQEKKAMKKLLLDWYKSKKNVDEKSQEKEGMLAYA